MNINSFIYRVFRSPQTNNTQTIKVQLGPGQNNYLNGWLNVDSNLFTAKIDIWANISYTLPFKNSSVDAFYSHHVIEHLPSLSTHFDELYRCLKKGGIIRIGGPNGDSGAKKMLEGDLAWFPDFPDNRASIGGRFDNFIMCRNEHLVILTYSYLEELLTLKGFKNIKICLPTRDTNYSNYISSDVLAKEWESDFLCPHTLIVEAEK